MRELLEEAEEHYDRRARLAIEIFAYRARKYVGAYLAAMGGADAIVFTGGHRPERAAHPGHRSWRVWNGWAGAGRRRQPVHRGRSGSGPISPGGVAPRAWVIPTDEELLIARDTVRLVLGLETRY
jgi:acetate kinase